MRKAMPRIMPATLNPCPIGGTHGMGRATAGFIDTPMLGLAGSHRHSEQRFRRSAMR
jgi:hypothetical protein